MFYHIVCGHLIMLTQGLYTCFTGLPALLEGSLFPAKFCWSTVWSMAVSILALHSVNISSTVDVSKFRL